MSSIDRLYEHDGYLKLGHIFFIFFQHYPFF